MTKLQRLLVYGFTLFILIVGIDLIDYSLSHTEGEKAILYSPFHVTYFIYVLFTLIAVRFILNSFYPSKKLLLLSIGIILMFPVFILFRYLLEEILAPLLIGQSNYIDSTTFAYYVADNFGYALYYIIIGVLLYMLDYNIIHQKKLHLLETKNKEAELDNLRAQLNPHFLFNSLNNIYTLVSEKSDNAADAIMRLSDLTKYLIYEKAHTCNLIDEINHTENFIQLQQLRFEQDIVIDKVIQGDLSNMHIPPFTLVTFIENAFKHGDFKNASIPLKINISGANNTLHIIVSNKIGKHNKDGTRGVGLSNIRKRLELTFPNKFHLTTRTESNIFTIELTIYYRLR